jgi:glycosyltransferase involved in cell wall biosynthesis
MKIAQVAPLFESVPPRHYGGTERVVSYLTEELVRMGHDVTLFASADSVTAAHLVAPTPRSLRLDPNADSSLPYHVLLLDRVFREARHFDLIHFHIDYLHFAMSRLAGCRQITTLHGRLDIPDLVPLYREFLDMPLVSISNAQRSPLPWANWQGTVYHGLPLDLYTPGSGAGGYLAFIGRISPEKRVDRAIEIAKEVGMPLRIAAKIDRADEVYFKQEIEPLFDSPLIEFVGEVGDGDKSAFLGEAKAMLFPIDWPEPFGLVMIEAMACGTPIVAWRGGSVTEVVTEGETGFVVDNIDDAVAATRRIGTLSRQRCRQVFERRFSVTSMAEAYLAVYERMFEQAARPLSAPGTARERRGA